MHRLRSVLGCLRSDVIRVHAGKITHACSKFRMSSTKPASLEPVVVCVNDTPLVVPGFSSTTLLKECPRGAYTTGRTSRHRTALFEYDVQVSRMVRSACLMQDGMAGEHSHLSTHISTEKQFANILSQTLKTSVAAFNEAYGAPEDARELKITALLTWGGAVSDTFLSIFRIFPSEILAPYTSTMQQYKARDFALIMHVTTLPRRRAPPILVQVRGAPRSVALAKDSEWVRTRESLEAVKPAEVDEILLVDESSGDILEGTQTNFFAVKGGTVYTAGEGVLEGTVRRLVIDICAMHNIPLSLTPPNLAEVHSWDGAFITSTSRLLLPIDEISFPSAVASPHHHHEPHHSMGEPLPAPDSVHSFGKSELVSRLRQLVDEEVDRFSVSFA